MLELPHGEVHLWRTSPESIRDPEALQRQFLSLSEKEREQHGRFVFERHRHQYLVSHALVRNALSRYARLPPAAWRFAFNSHGRPSIDQPEEFRSLRFNLSHTEGRAVVAVARDCEIGVDVESTIHKGDLNGIAERFFAPEEIAQLSGRPDSFFDFWTLKEAYIKARGLGLAIPLDSFWFDLTGQGPPRISFYDAEQESAARWRFVLQREGQYRTALAVSWVLAAHLQPAPRQASGILSVIEREVVPMQDSA